MVEGTRPGLTLAQGTPPANPCNKVSQECQPPTFTKKRAGRWSAGVAPSALHRRGGLPWQKRPPLWQGSSWRGRRLGAAEDGGDRVLDPVPDVLLPSAIAGGASPAAQGVHLAQKIGEQPLNLLVGPGPPQVGDQDLQGGLDHQQASQQGVGGVLAVRRARFCVSHGVLQ